MSAIDRLFAELAASIPALPGAACKGRHQLFDPQPDDRHPDIARRLENTALSICKTCPALEPCRAWLAGLEPHQRPFGVTAGKVRRERPRRRGGDDTTRDTTTDNPDQQTA